MRDSKLKEGYNVISLSIEEDDAVVSHYVYSNNKEHTQKKSKKVSEAASGKYVECIKNIITKRYQEDKKKEFKGDLVGLYTTAMDARIGLYYEDKVKTKVYGA